MSRNLLAASVTSLLFFASAAQAATVGFTEDFNGGNTAGFGGGGSQVHVATGGVGGVGDGYLEVSRATAANLGTFNGNDEYVGNLIADGVTGFSFWLNDTGADDPLEIHVGVGLAFGNFWVTTAGYSPPENDWAEFSVDLTNPSDWVQIIGGGTFEDALMNSDRLLFRHDLAPYVQDPDDLAGGFGLDRITVLPEPASALALLIGGVLALRRR